MRRRLALVLIGGLTLSGCVARGQASDQSTVRSERITLGSAPSAASKLGPLAFEAGFVLSSSDLRFGGLSGLWLAPDDGRLIAVSDHGTVWIATLQRSADGRLLGFAGWEAVEPGRAAGDPQGRDAEALAEDGRGGLVIAYEGEHRLRRFALDDLKAAPMPLPTPKGLGEPSNVGIEALVDLPDGALLALAEGVFDRAGDLDAWRITSDGIDQLSFASSEGFVPTGADRLADTIYVVERRLTLLGGFATRIVMVRADDVRPGARLAGRTLAELRAPLVAENFEGIAAARGPEGRVFLYLVSDDNFNALQRTLLLQFSLEVLTRRGGTAAACAGQLASAGAAALASRAAMIRRLRRRSSPGRSLSRASSRKPSRPPRCSTVRTAWAEIRSRMLSPRVSLNKCRWRRLGRKRRLVLLLAWLTLLPVNTPLPVRMQRRAIRRSSSESFGPAAAGSARLP